MRILPTSRRHGVLVKDMVHAHRNRIRVFCLDDALLVIGAATDGKPIELGMSFAEDRIFHAMPARAKLLTTIGRTGG